MIQWKRRYGIMLWLGGILLFFAYGFYVFSPERTARFLSDQISRHNTFEGEPQSAIKIGEMVSLEDSSRVVKSEKQYTPKALFYMETIVRLQQELEASEEKLKTSNTSQEHRTETEMQHAFLRKDIADFQEKLREENAIQNSLAVLNLNTEKTQEDVVDNQSNPSSRFTSVHRVILVIVFSLLVSLFVMRKEQERREKIKNENPEKRKMICDLCNQEILFKKDLYGGISRSFFQSPLSSFLGRNTRYVHYSCVEKTPIFKRGIMPLLLTGKTGNFLFICSFLGSIVCIYILVLISINSDFNPFSLNQLYVSGNLRGGRPGVNLTPTFLLLPGIALIIFTTVRLCFVKWWLKKEEDLLQ